MSAPLTADYNDGHESRTHAVRLLLLPGVLAILDADTAEERDAWPADDVRLVDRPGTGALLRLRRADGSPARLTLDGWDALPSLERHCPHLKRNTDDLRGQWRRVLAWSVGAAAALAVIIGVVIPFVAVRMAASIPEPVAAQLGEVSLNQIAGLFAKLGSKDKDALFCQGAAGRAALDALLDALVKPGDLKDRTLHVHVLDHKMVNAFALPGGQVVVMRGLIEAAGDQHELASVIAHEIGHVIEHHPMEVTMEQSALSVLVGLFIGDVTGGTVMAGLGQALIGAAYSRDAEREADAIAVRLLTRAGMDPDGLTRFFERVRKKYGEMPAPLQLFASHPSFADRIDAVPVARRQVHDVIDAQAFADLKGICGGGK